MNAVASVQEEKIVEMAFPAIFPIGTISTNCVGTDGDILLNMGQWVADPDKLAASR